MRAVVIREPGGLDQLELTDWPVAEPGPGQVRVRVAACGVCYRDIVDRRGGYAFMRRPIVTGHEWAGTISAVGSDVAGFAVGDRVATTHRPACGDCPACRAGDDARCTRSLASYGQTVDGGYGEEVLAWPSSLVRVPDAVPLDAASFLHCTAAVALRALRRHAHLERGETVVITGASGGVGVHAIQIAKGLGARVLAVTGAAGKIEPLRDLGADEVLLAPADGGFHKLVHAVTHGGADVALDLVGTPTLNASLRSVRMSGRITVVGNVSEERFLLNPGAVIMRELVIAGSSGATRAELAEVLDMAADGRLRPVLAERLPLEQARAAQERLERRGAFGRTVLVP
jgi:D-arabinose 1-dehydrogenase-like Zn-dependent alcohol dehydrogenase